MGKKEKKDGIYFIVNGQPIEMCPKTLNLCNKRAQNLLLYLKKQSMENIHTMRFFWGDVIMLNILTNQLLQSVNSRSLARILKPVNTLQEDLEEYRIQHKEKIDKIKDALIIANDDTLPLDYSRELEKYYKKVDIEDTGDIEDIEYEDSTENVHSKSDVDTNKENSKDNKQEIKIENKVPSTQTSDTQSEENTVQDTITLPSTHSDKTPESIDTNDNALEQKTEFERHQESFANFDTIDISSLFT